MKLPSLTLLPLALLLSQPTRADLPAFLEQHCTKCHDADTQKGNLDLAALKPDYANPESFARWVKVHDLSLIHI